MSGYTHNYSKIRAEDQAVQMRCMF